MCADMHFLRSTLLIKNFDFQWSRVAAAEAEGQHELETRPASTTAASATGASDLPVGGGARAGSPPAYPPSVGLRIGSVRIAISIGRRRGAGKNDSSGDAEMGRPPFAGKFD